MLTIFLGAGFGRVADLPLARNIFDDIPEMDRFNRKDLGRRVHERWQRWHATHGGTAEQYLADLQLRPRQWGTLESRSIEWKEAVQLVGLNIATRMGQVNRGNYQGIRHHDVFRATGIPAYESFWDEIFRRTTQVAVVTTNYDILAERGIRAVPHQPGKYRVRPGFNYGIPNERLEVRRGAFTSLKGEPVLRGSVPIFKLHGSVNWLESSTGVKHYSDCWPAIYSTPALVAPVQGKQIPPWATQTWDAARRALEQSDDWLFIGYSLPPYDTAVADLLHFSADHAPRVHLMDPKRSVMQRFQRLLPRTKVRNYGLFPAGLDRFLSVWSPSDYWLHRLTSAPRAVA